MKKAFILLLAISLLCMGVALAEPAPPYVPLEDPGNLVLDIPWGISVDELQSLVKEKTGWELVAGEKVNGITSYYRTPDTAEPSFLGEPCETLRFLVNGVPANAVGEFYRVALVEYPLLEGLPGEEVVHQIEKLLKTYSDHYGAMHHIHIQVGTGIENSEVFFDFPFDADGQIDQDALLLATRELGVINVFACFQNISLTSDIYYNPESDLYLWYSLAVFVQPTEETAMPKFHDLDSLGSFTDFYETQINPTV